MTGERMETVRGTLRHTIEWHPDALAEVERWEHDRARLTAIETAAQALIDLLYTPREYDDGYENDQGQWVSRKALSYVATGRGDPLVDGLRAALGEGQDSDQLLETDTAEVLAIACHDHTFVSETCHNTPATPCDDDGATMGGWGECPCDGTRGCVCQ